MYNLEISKDNLRILKINHNGKEKYIGSYYNHKRDIDKFIKEIEDINDNSVIVTYGVMDGEHLLELCKEEYKNIKVIVFEKEERLLQNIKNDKYYSKILENKNIKIFKFDEEVIEKVFSMQFSLGNVYNLKIINSPLLLDYNNKEMIFISNILKKLITHSVINLNTCKHFSERWFETFIGNFDYCLNSTFLSDIKDSIKNKPAIILSAGPSLEKNINLLKECKDEFFIISGGRTLAKLEEINVKPDLCVIIDGGQISYDIVKDNIKNDIPLVFCNGTNEKIVQEHIGKKIYDSTGIDFISPIIKKNQTGMFGGGSVAHACINTAIHIGCNPIILIGQDLAYTNDKVHANFCELTEDKYKRQEVLENIRSENDIYVDDIYGNKVRTSKSLNMFRENIEKIVRNNPHIKFINATEGGANIKGTEVITLKEAINKYSLKENIEKNIHLEETLSDDEKEMVIDEFNKTVEYLKEIKRKCNQSIKLNKKIKKVYNRKDYEEYNIIDKKMQKLEDEINDLYVKAHYIKTLVYPIVVNVEINNEWVWKYGESEEVQFKKLYNKTKFLYSTMERKVDYAIKFIERNRKINE